MTKEKEVTTYKGITFAGLLQILFLGLKLGKVIDWKWIWVFAPTWGPAALVITFLLLMVILALLADKR